MAHTSTVPPSQSVPLSPTPVGGALERTQNTQPRKPRTRVQFNLSKREPLGWTVLPAGAQRMTDTFGHFPFTPDLPHPYLFHSSEPDQTARSFQTQLRAPCSPKPSLTSQTMGPAFSLPISQTPQGLGRSLSEQFLPHLVTSGTPTSSLTAPSHHLLCASLGLSSLPSPHSHSQDRVALPGTKWNTLPLCPFSAF